MSDVVAPLISYWPVVVVAGGGLIAWGRHHERLNGHERELENKASKDTVMALDTRLDRIEGKVDKLLER